MPSAVPEEGERARFVADLGALLATAGLPLDAPLGVALSGGPDSAALLLLAAAAALGPVRALTVDHGLRAEAAGEAAGAAALCERAGVPHDIAHVVVAQHGGGGVQAAARSARYAALAAWAARHSIAAILTAHHGDDQAETMLMRMARGSGVTGLSAIRAARRLECDGRALLILRPLLSWRKAELEAVCAAAGITPARDSSNADPRFDRTAARALLAANPWLVPSRLAASAAHCAEADAALAAIADERYVIARDGEEVLLRPDPLAEIARRQLRRLLTEEFSAAADGPSLDRTLRALSAGVATTCADTLCRVQLPFWRFRRAPPRRSI